MLATNVSVITAASRGRYLGCTATAWAEGTDPPYVLTTLACTHATLLAVLDAGGFCVNVLTIEQRSIAVRFGEPELEAGLRFRGLDIEVGRSGAPIIADSLAALECELVAHHPFGQMDIVVGTIVASHGDSNRTRPLLHYKRRLGTFTSDDPTRDRRTGS